MKRLYYFSLMLLISLSAVKAQKPITLADDSVKFGNRYFPGFWLSIPETKPSAVKTSWIKAIEKGTKTKVKVDKNEMTLFGAIITDIYDGSMNIISKTVDYDSLTKLFVSAETTRDNFIGRSSSEFDKLSKYLKKFGKEQYVKVAKDQLSAEEAKLRDLEKDLKSARKSNERFEKGIQSAKVRISEQNDKIKNINKELEILEIRIGNSSTILSTLEEGDDKKAKQSELKDLQKKKKSLLKDINSAENSISKANTSIHDNKKDIELNDDKQKELGEKIIQQKHIIDKFEKKLKTIESY
jgi:peptidoglycan hydrolase CwlO-like protein